MNAKILVIAGLTLLLAACSKLTTENYDKLKVGMAYTEVESLLGTPSECNSVMGIKQCTWGDEKRNIHVSFAGDQVLVYSATGLR